MVQYNERLTAQYVFVNKTLKVDELIKHYNIVLSCRGQLLLWVLRELAAHCCLAGFHPIQESHEFAFGIQCGRFLK